jgi:D-serine deaminase-like pyridoxal phosphate-dependent protein
MADDRAYDDLPREMMGRSRAEPATPALILDLPRVRANLAEMARRMEGLPAKLRPHTKIHKSPILGQMQLDAGGLGLTTATV